MRQQNRQRRFRRLLQLIPAIALLATFVAVPPGHQPGPAAAMAETRLGCGDRADGVIAAVTINVAAGGDATPVAVAGGDVVALTSDGAELGRVAVGQNARLWPLGVGCLLAGTTGEDQLAIVDPAGGTITPIRTATPLDDDADNYLPFPNARHNHLELRWALLGNYAGSSLLLVDAQSGGAVDLAEAIREASGGEDPANFLYNAQLAADERHLLVASQQLWLFSIDRPTSPRRIENGGTGTLSPGGAHLLYTRDEPDSAKSLVVEDLAAGDTRVVLTGERPSYGVWVSDGSDGGDPALLVAHESGIGLIDRTTMRERSLYTHTGGEPIIPWGVNPKATAGLAFFDGADGDRHWLWLDLTAGTARDLEQLRGRGVAYAKPEEGFRWIAFPPNGAAPSVAAGDSIVGLDLDTGIVTDLLTFDKEIRGISYRVSDTGRYLAAGAFDPDLDPSGQSSWLLDLERGTATYVAGLFIGAFSPDLGSILLTERLPREAGRPPVTRLIVRALATGEEQTIAEEYFTGLFWLPLRPLP